MKGHISNRNLAAYIADTMEASARDRFAKHLAACGRCRGRHDMLLSALSPRYAALRPGDEVRTRVMSTRDRLERGDGGSDSAGLPFRLRPLALGAAAFGLAAALAVALVFSLSPWFPRRDARPALVAMEAGDGVTSGGEALVRGALLREPGVIVVPDNASARLAYGEGFSMTLTGPSVMRIDRLDRRGRSGAVVLECALEQGIVVSRAGGDAVSYAYTTPGARVVPAGTEFLLQASGNDTLVVMKSGSVRLRPSRPGAEAIVEAGSRCLVGERTVISKATVEEMGIFDSPRAVHAGSRGLRLLPVLPLKKNIPGVRRSIEEQARQHPRVRGRLSDGKRPVIRERVEARAERDGDRAGKMHQGGDYSRRRPGATDNIRESLRDRRVDRSSRKRPRRALSR